jgi:intein/homing endonuclease
LQVPGKLRLVKVNAVGKRVSEASRAYLAGFLDADGSIMAVIEKHPEKKFGFRVRVIVKITQHNEEILQWFLRQFRIGRIQRNRRAYDWIIRDQSSVKEFLVLIRPYLRLKAKQARIAIKILEMTIFSRSELLKVAQLADTLSELNVRSKNRRNNYTVMIQETLSRND